MGERAGHFSYVCIDPVQNRGVDASTAVAIFPLSPSH
jgi:hypothetical protein